MCISCFWNRNPLFSIKSEYSDLIENNGFNGQKCHGLHLEHVFSYKNNAMKCHYFLIQIAHTLIQLFEFGWKPMKIYKQVSDRYWGTVLCEHFRNRMVTPEMFEAAISVSSRSDLICRQHGKMLALAKASCSSSEAMRSFDWPSLDPKK
jgi:hypothetical protein